MTTKWADKSKAEEIKEAKRMVEKYKGSHIGATLGERFETLVAYNASNDLGTSLYDEGWNTGVWEGEGKGQSEASKKIAGLESQLTDEIKNRFFEVSELKDQISRKDARVAELEDNISTYMEEVEALNQNTREAQNWRQLRGVIRDIIK